MGEITIVPWKQKDVLVEIARNAWKISTIFYRFLVMIKVYLKFLLKVGVFGERKTEGSFIIMEKEYIRFDKLRVWRR